MIMLMGAENFLDLLREKVIDVKKSTHADCLSKLDDLSMPSKKRNKLI